MTEAIELLEKQLNATRSQIQGVRSRIEAYSDSIKSEHEMLDQLSAIELRYHEAVTKLRN